MEFPQLGTHTGPALPHRQSDCPRPLGTRPGAAVSWSWFLPSPAESRGERSIFHEIFADFSALAELFQHQQIEKGEMFYTSTTDELLTARAISFPSVVNFFILLKETRSDMSTSRGKKKVWLWNQVMCSTPLVFLWNNLQVLSAVFNQGFRENFYHQNFKFTYIYNFFLC